MPRNTDPGDEVSGALPLRLRRGLVRLSLLLSLGFLLLGLVPATVILFQRAAAGNALAALAGAGYAALVVAFLLRIGRVPGSVSDRAILAGIVGAALTLRLGVVFAWRGFVQAGDAAHLHGFVTRVAAGGLSARTWPHSRIHTAFHYGSPGHSRSACRCAGTSVLTTYSLSRC